MGKNSNLLLIILAVITCLSVCLAAWALFLRDPTPVLPPDEELSEEVNAIPTGDENDEKMDQPQGGGAVNITYSDQVAVSLSDKSSSLMFANPSRSNQSMVVEVMIQDTIVVRSGLLHPGNQVESLPLLDTAVLSPGGYEGKFLVGFYGEDGTEAILHTEIPVSITVTE